METQPLPGGAVRGHTLENTPHGLRARAWWGEQLVAESTAALRLEQPGQPPALYFPVDDVRFELFRAEGRSTSDDVKGTARLWSMEGGATGEGAGSPPAAASWDGPDVATAPDGTGGRPRLAFRLASPAHIIAGKVLGLPR